MMACPEKHRTLGNFHEYYSGVKKAPMLTIFVGGNHEASNYLWELLSLCISFLSPLGFLPCFLYFSFSSISLYKVYDINTGYTDRYHGGWVCPNIYFLGFGNVINIGGVRIAGLTGIYNHQHYELGKSFVE